jgi:NADH-ubiquinone oxidoreductase chain 5
MYLLIIFMPFLNFLIISLLGRYLIKSDVISITIFNLSITLFAVVFVFYEIVLCETICTIELFNWIFLNDFVVNWNFYFDNLTATMLIIIMFISYLVHLYSFEYMFYDPHINRFISYLSLFTFFMIILVTSSNFIQLFLGWEGVGLASYLLINFWFTRINANKSAIKAVILNRIGDLSLFIAFSIIIIEFKTVNYLELILLVSVDQNSQFIFEMMNLYDFISIFLLIGAIGKSSQIGLHIWLPDAMEGPTPVSALIHAATMVTAGVFLLIRSSFFLEFTNNTSYIIALVGGLTAFFAATIGTMQNDIKRIIAYSTCSQLGYMVFACGFHNYNVSFFHLFNHAFFKALLFLTAGAIIHSLNDEQDIRKMGGLFKLLPFSYISFFIGSLALTGFPFLTGFYSKDFLLELTLTNFSNLNLFIYWLSCTAACCTAFYSFRLIFFVFFNKTQNYKKIIENIHENGIKINICLFLLMLCSIFVGFIFKDLIIGVGSIFWTNVLIINPFNNNLYNSEFLETYYKLLPLIISFFGIFICFLIYNIKINLYLCKLFLNHKNLRFLYFFINKRWFFDLIYNFIINYFYKISFNIFFIKIDRGFLELLGPLGLTRIIYSLSINYTNYFQNGLFKYYLKIYLIFILIFFNIFFINNNNLFIFNFLNFFEIFIFIFIIENLIDKSKYKL